MSISNLAVRGKVQFCASLTASAVWQCLCVASALWLIPAVHPVHSLRESNYATIRLLPMPRIGYRPITLSRTSSHEHGGLTGERTALSHPRLPHGTAVREIREAESWAAPVIGNPELGFAAPLTLSLDQPSRPVELRVGDFGEATSAIGSERAGHGPRNGFLESGFGGGGGEKPMDREPVRIISKPTPAYTQDARSKKIEGDVIIDVIFTADRRIVILRILQSIGYGLDQTGVQAVSQIVFRPAKENGRAVDFRARVRVEFRLIRFRDSEQGNSL